MTEQELAQQLHLPVFLQLPEQMPPKDLYKQIPYSFAKQNLVLPFLLEEEGALLVAMADPLAASSLAELRTVMECPLKPAWAPKELILEAIELCYAQEEEQASKLIAGLQSLSPDEDAIDLEDLLNDQEERPIIQLLNAILLEAIQLRASDIHFEPFENDLKVRYRIDGVLQKRHSPPKEYQGALITRLKVMAKLDIAEHRLPQDGRIKLLLGERSIDLRVSTIPVAYGERVVLRILDQGSVTLGLEFLSMPKPIVQEFERFIHYPEGLILVTGPTGSGKTTTLYSAIKEIHHEGINIMTIEDPIEYKLHGIAQMSVAPKINLDFATGLRHILRQDPDAILIGEIRDRETAEIAIQASMTGHLVFSTLHTNDAPSSISRLIDMGIEPYLLSSSVLLVLAQRLVRLLCPLCKERYTPSLAELQELQLSPTYEFYKSKGCNACYGCGFRGRRGIYELMVIEEPHRKEILAKGGQLRPTAIACGMHTLLDHGKSLVAEGETSIQELLRIVRER